VKAHIRGKASPSKEGAIPPNLGLALREKASRSECIDNRREEIHCCLRETDPFQNKSKKGCD
jgi:hypothetical protein